MEITEYIPEEILALICSFVQKGVQGVKFGSELEHDLARAIAIRPLSETCRKLRRICLPFLFEAVILDGRTSSSQRRASISALNLARDPNIARLVRRTRIVDWRASSESILRCPLTCPGCWMATTRLQTAGLRCVEIRNTLTTQLLLDHLQRLPRLEDLSLTAVGLQELAGELRQNTIYQYSYCALKHFTLLPGLEVVNPYKTTQFVVPSLQTFRTNTTWIQNASSIHHLLPQLPASLREVAIMWQSGPISEVGAGLRALLRLCPELESLELPSLPVGIVHFFPPDNQIPKLQSFEGGPDNTLLFCKDRPVRTLRVSLGLTDGRIETRKTLLRPGSVPLHHIHIDGVSWKINTMAFISRHCPELKSLGVRAARKDHVVWMLHPMPHLERACFLLGNGPWYGSECSPDHDASILLGSHNIWPRLKGLRLHPDYCWIRLSGAHHWELRQDNERMVVDETWE